MTDPFDVLATPVEAQAPRPAFTRDLRARLVTELGLDVADALPTVDLPERSPVTTTTTAPTRTPAATAAKLVPYITVSDGGRALEWYGEAFGAVEHFRVVGDDGRVGHASLAIGDAELMLSDAYPDLGVHSPESLGGTPFALHLTVGDVDALFARAVAAGAVSLMEPADQPHGARHGTLVDPFGHRWMLSQQVEDLTVEEYAQRSEGSGFEVVGAGPGESVSVADRPGSGGGIWSAVFSTDALGTIRFLVDVLGFEEQLVVLGPDDRTVVHSQLRWPEGGIVQVGTYDPSNPYARPPGSQGLYVVTADPEAVWARCQAAGVDVVAEPSTPDYDPGGMGFSVRDPDGGVWSFGSYGLGQT